ncbi:ABC transporter substrate-binding protein [Paenibacillus mendelii]|uniref:ABC transporter substrate-binding protein n=1 Tax=Paenibacillus mendelii TaxID=206163 RepID=A0ABV6J466_9BACL|nr:sugar ABC transporter substrate-binding protein [Paenibacillus mendelii]MCQ6559373.1 sugar ABC transporter substrate-binding protein [Paenibacillus mendelii]
MKNRRAMFLLMLVLMLAATACTPNMGGGAGSNQSEGNIKSGANNGVTGETDNKKLTIWVFADPHKRFLEAVNEEFKKTHPDVTVDVNLMDANAMTDKYMILSRSGGDGAPDLFDMEQGQFPNFIRGDVPFEPLDQYLEVDGLKEAMSKGRQALYTVNNKQYGIEHAATASALYYRKDIFDEAGINVAELKTWDAFTEAAKKLTGKDKYIFPADSETRTGSDRTYFELLIKQEGGDVVTTDGGIGLDSPEAIAALKRMHDWKKEGIMDTRYFEGPSFWDRFKNGTYVAAFGPDWWVNLLVDNVPELSGKWAAVPMPLGGPSSVPTTVMGGTGMMISKFSKNKDLAWEYLKTAQLTPAMSVKRFEIINLFPALLTSVNEAGLHETSKYTEYFADQDLGDLYGKLVADAPNQNQAWWRPLITQAWDKHQFDYAEGKLTPEQFLQKVREELERLIEKEKKVAE